jgi:chaperone BCS1
MHSRITTFLESKEWYIQNGLAWSYGILLSGDPGTGKTSLIKAISTEWKLSLYIMQLSKTTSAADLERMVNYLPAKCILVFEDIDCVGISEMNRSCEEEHSALEKIQSKSKITLSDLLNTLDGVNEANGRIVIMTSNYPERLDSALKRARRIDFHCKLTSCTEDMFIKFFQNFYNNFKIPEDILYNLVKKNISPADVSVSILNNRNSAISACNELLQFKS